MKRFVLSICAVALIVSSIGCACSCNNCRQRKFQGQCRDFQGARCGHNGCGPQCRLGNGGGLGGGMCGAQPAAPMGAAQVAYPYYTLRGPRDFLDPNPRSIGP